MPRVRLTVKLKPALLDSSGRAVADTLVRLGFGEVKDVRVGKVIDLEVDELDPARIEEMAKQLLANPVTEDYQIEALS